MVFKRFVSWIRFVYSVQKIRFVDLFRKKKSQKGLFRIISIHVRIPHPYLKHILFVMNLVLKICHVLYSFFSSFLKLFPVCCLELYQKIMKVMGIVINS